MTQQIDIVANLLMKVDGAESGLKKLQNSLSGLKLPKGLDSDLKKSMSNLEGLFATYRKQIEKGFDTKGDVSAFTKTAKSVNAEYDRITRTLDKLNNTNVTFNIKSDNIKKVEQDLDNIIKKRNQLSTDTQKSIAIDLANIQKAGSRSTKVQDYSNMLGVAINKGQWQEALRLAQLLKTQFEGLSDKTKQAFATMSNGKSATAALDDIVAACRKGGEGFDNLEKEGKEAAELLASLQAKDLEQIEKALAKMGGEWQESTNGAKALNGEMTELARSTQSMSQQLGDLQQSTQYFFSLRNMINLLKRGISDAVQTVKELDKAMTETAVVTDFSVGDMWAKLPEYTANANKLGATIQDMYESTTLYYQQGLNTQQSMAIATETMKMARIAGLEAKDATDMMTAALRGFNMELNETSAERINDVYSNLAAKTASDTEEIGKAMQRTASIAHSAGMSFEGTAAFLAQAVETTREPAENIGTAMKTIVARFQEMKKNPLEITEVDGEEVSYNKVDEALQSIGVSLKDANGQFRELDKVFLDISKRWNSLSQTQQRYIATIAAGSRQQSRFIAMMGDYDRTVELMRYANDSAGASQEQFNKTLDSLEAKINKFQNAWDQFLMGIMNDSWVKGLVDTGTTILKTVNGIIDALSFGGKAKGLKSLLSIGAAGVALKAGGNLINKLIGGVGGFIDPASSFGKGFWGAGKTTQEGTPATGVAGKITTPIVAKLNELIAVTRQANNLKNINTQTASTLGQYKNTSAMLRNTQSLGMGEIRALFNGLSDEHAYAAYKNTPGTVDSMKNAALGWLSSQRMPADAQKTGQQLMSAIFKGMSKKEIPIKDGMKLMGKPALWGEYFGTDVAKSFSQQYINQFKAQIPQMKQNTQTALQQTWQQLLGKNANNKAMQQGFLASQIGKDKFISAYKNNRASLGLDQESINNIPVIQNHFQQLANKVGVLGSKFSAAGMSLQMFGAQLGQLSPALEGVGTLLSRVGMTISTFGMGISGLGAIVTKGAAAIKAGTALAVSSMAATPGVIGAGAAAGKGFITGMAGSLGMSTGLLGGIIGAVVIGAIALVKGHLDKKAKEAGEEVRENFEKGFTETNKKIDSIEGYKDRFNELSKGVDQFGHNISLTDEEYDEYLSISRDLQELSPSLISGYNAEGQAILRKGAALDEVIDKLKEERDLSLRDYITDDSIQKLIGEYNTSDAYKNHNTIKMGDSGMGDAFESERSSISKAIKEAELEWSDFSQILDELGIGGAESINDLSNRQLSMISAHYTDILNKIKEFNPQIEEEAEDGLKEAFAETNNALEDVLTEGAPIVDALRQWMGQEKLDAVGLGLSEEFVSGFNSGLDGLMVEGLTNNWKPEEYKAQLRDYANEWEHLAGPTSTYANILSEADKIQQQYLDHISEDNAIQNYENDVEGLANQLELLAEQYKGTGTAGEVFAEQCQQQANNLRNYATEGVLTLGEALNTLSDEFASARGAQERFQKATEGGDYYTAAEGYKSIIDTMLDEKNTIGNGSDGSLTFWAGADELLGQKYVDSHTANEVVKQVEKIKGCFEDGLPGIQQFGDLLVENADKLKGLGEINENGQFEFNFKNLDDLEKYAELLGMSEDALAALIDKSRQYVPWNLSDPGAVRKAIEDSQYSMAGVSTRGENLVYTSESQFRAEARQQGIRGDDYTKTRSDAEERGVRFLNVENLTAKKGDGLYADQVLENVGLKGQDKTVENAVAAFTKMGLDLEDTKQVLMSDGIKLADGEEATAENIEKAYNEQAYAVENPTVTGIATDTSTLVSNTSAMLAAMGILTEDAKKEIDQATNEDTTQGYIDNLQNASSLNERNTARTTMEDKVSEYNALANKLVEAGRSETDPYVQKLRGAAEALQTELDAEAKNWNDKAVAANQYLKENNIVPQSATAEEQKAIQMHAVDLQSAIETGDANTVIETLKQIETEGNLSIETMIALGQSVSDLGAVDSSSILHFISEYQEKLKLARQESNQPFEIETKFTGEKLEDHISEVEEFTTQEYAFLVRADVSGDEKVSTLINSINQEFGNGDQETKTILIDAVAKTANGNKKEAHSILAEAFGEDKAETIEKKIDVLCDGSVANKDEVIKALEGELKEVPLNAKTKANVDVDASIESLKTSGNTMHYSTEVDTKGIDDAKAYADGKTGTIKIGGDNKEAKKAADAAKTYADRKTGKITIDAVKGSGWNGAGWSINVSAHKHGRNYSIPTNPSISFGSAAKGMNIPKPKKTNGSQITALVGEEGFEVGYIPSERRSVIFGANGPEMTSFPSDTIIYPHGQSKKILQRGKGAHKSLYSFEYGKTGSSGGIPTSSSGSSTYASTQVKNNKDTHSANVKKAAAEVIKITQKAGKVLVWWENAGHRMDLAQRNAEGVQRELQNLLKQFGTTADQYKQSGEAYEKYLNQQMQIAAEKEERANTELQMTSEGRASVHTEKVDTAREKMKSAKATYEAYKTKKNKKAYEKAKDKYEKAANAELAAVGARQEISYEVTKKKKDKKGKWKKTKVTKKANVNLGKYITYDKETGLYQIDQAEIDKVAKTNQSKAQAIADAAEKQLSELLNKQKQAEEERIKAEEELAEFYDDTYETFYSWDKVITEAYLLGQQLEKLSGLRNIYDSVEDLEFAKLEAGFSDVTNSLPKVAAALERNKNIMVAQVQANSALVDATWSEYQKAFSIDTYKKRYESSPNSEKAAKDYDSMKVALDFLDSLNLGSNNFDYQAAVNSINANEWSQEDFNKIKDGLDKIAEKQGDYYNAIADTYTSMADIYKTIEEYQSYMADFESSLIKGLEEQANKEIDSLSKLNDTLSTAAKDLIDEVKRKLDERRKQEDNRKTEQDISQKQQRLAMLRANTSSGNQVEIARLEKEIAEAQQGYGRTLEDQLLDRLSQQQDEAAKQRERQISLLEAQRDLATALGTNVEEVNTWLADLNGNEELIKQAWLANNGYNEAGTNERKQLEEAFNEAWTRYKAYGEVLPSYEEIAGKYEGPDAPKPIVNPIKSINDKMTTIIGLIDPKTAQDQNIIPPEASATTNEENPPKTNNTPQANNTPKIDRSAIKAKEELDRAKHEVQKKENLIKQYEQKISTNEQNIGQLIRERSQIRDSRQISALNSRITSLQSQNNSYKGSIVKLQEEIRFLRNKYKFKKGGLASSTGPAWLDGTPTKPELVLNAQDTQNFLALRDILSKVIGSTNSITNSYGGNATYEININVDKIEKDYDVDRVIEKVKKEITKGAGYRNVTQVRSFR